MRQIVEKIIEQFSVDRELFYRSKKQYYSDLRAVCYTILREEGYRVSEIAKYFGKHHSTIINGLRVARDVKEVQELRKIVYSKIKYNENTASHTVKEVV